MRSKQGALITPCHANVSKVRASPYLARGISQPIESLFFASEKSVDARSRLYHAAISTRKHAPARALFSSRLISMLIGRRSANPTSSSSLLVPLSLTCRASSRIQKSRAPRTRAFIGNLQILGRVRARNRGDRGRGVNASGVDRTWETLR